MHAQFARRVDVTKPTPKMTAWGGLRANDWSRRVVFIQAKWCNVSRRSAVRPTCENNLIFNTPVKIYHQIRDQVFFYPEKNVKTFNSSIILFTAMKTYYHPIEFILTTTKTTLQNESFLSKEVDFKKVCNILSLFPTKNSFQNQAFHVFLNELRKWSTDSTFKWKKVYLNQSSSQKQYYLFKELMITVMFYGYILLASMISLLLGEAFDAHSKSAYFHGVISITTVATTSAIDKKIEASDRQEIKRELGVARSFFKFRFWADIIEMLSNK